MEHEIVKANAEFEYGISNNTVCIIKYLGKYPTLIFPDLIDGMPVTGLDNRMFFNMETGCCNDDKITSIHIPASIMELNDWDMFIGCKKLESITVESGNPSYSSANGVLYGIREQCLIQYPMNKPDKAFAIPDGVVSIGDGSFFGYNPFDSALAEITIPYSVYEFGLCMLVDSFSAKEHEFSDAWIVHGRYFDCIPNTVHANSNGTVGREEYKKKHYNIFEERENITIICDEGSPAHQYAINLDIPFRLMDSV